MKKRTKKFLAAIVVFLFSICAISILVINKTRLFDLCLVGGERIDKYNDEITFTASPFKSYMHIMLEIDDKTNLKNGLSYEIINPKGKVVETGVLQENIRVNKSCKGMSGEWKVKFDFVDDSKLIIMIGFASTSIKENNMKVETRAIK